MPTSGLVSDNERAVRLPLPSFAGFTASDVTIDAVQGPSQLLRPDTCPACFARHSRTRGDALANSARIPAFTAESPAPGANTYARSLTKPSPLMSLETSGVKGTPDTARPVA